MIDFANNPVLVKCTLCRADTEMNYFNILFTFKRILPC